MLTVSEFLSNLRQPYRSQRMQRGASLAAQRVREVNRTGYHEELQQTDGIPLPSLHVNGVPGFFDILLSFATHPLKCRPSLRPDRQSPKGVRPRGTPIPQPAITNCMRLAANLPQVPRQGAFEWAEHSTCSQGLYNTRVDPVLGPWALGAHGSCRSQRGRWQ